MVVDPYPVFVYGTLADAEQAAAVLDAWQYDGPAVLEGCHRVTGRYPTLSPGGETAGRLLRTPDLLSLDAYEGVDDGLYVRVDVPIADGGRAWIYVGHPDRLDATATWPGEGPFADRVRRYVTAADVRVCRVDNR